MKSRFHQINVGTQHCVRPLVSCTVSPRRDSVRWSGSSRVERAFHVASLEKLRQVTSSSPAGIWDSSLLSLFFFPRCVFVSEPGANVVPSFIRRAFNVSVAVSLRLGPPEPHGQAARPRVIDEFVRDGERSAVGFPLPALTLCAHAAAVQPGQTAQGELSAFDTTASHTRSQRAPGKATSPCCDSNLDTWRKGRRGIRQP